MNTTGRMENQVGAGSALIPSAYERPGNDPIFALNAEARRRAEVGESILNATLGALMRDDGTLAVMSSVLDTFQELSGIGSAGYAPISGAPDFLDAVITDAVGKGLRDRAVAVATPGGSGAIHHAMVNFIEPDQSALTSSFYWGPYAVIADHARRTIRTHTMFDANHGFDVGAFERELETVVDEQGRALILFNFPCNNPTGYALDAEEWGQVAEIVARVGRRAPVAFLLDHAYAKFGGHGGHGSPTWRDHLPRMLESATVLVAWTASKSFAQYGARVGALIALHEDPEERRRLENALNYSCRATWSNCNHLGLLAITRLLTDANLVDRTDAERAELTRVLHDRVAVFNEHAAAAGLDYPRYESGFFVTVFSDDAQGAAARMRDDGVFVVPMNGGVRVALCATPASAVPRLVESLAAGVAAGSAR